jgi:outer membrane biosynthesis protein TonB
MVAGGLLALAVVAALGWAATHGGWERIRQLRAQAPSPPGVTTPTPTPSLEPPQPPPPPKEAQPVAEVPAPPAPAPPEAPPEKELATAPAEIPTPHPAEPAHEALPRKERPKTEGKGARGEAVKLQRTGYQMLARGDVDGALGSFKKAIALNPVAALAYRGLGAAYSARGNTREAAKAYRRYLSLSPHAQDAAEVRALVQQLQ